MKDLYGLEAEVERRRKDMTEKHINDAAARLPVQPLGVVFDRPVGSKIRRLCALLRISDDECEELAAARGKESAEYHAKHSFCKAVARRIELEVRKEFPELLNRPYAIYACWSIGPAKEKAPRPEPSTTRDVHLGPLLHSAL